MRKAKKLLVLMPMLILSSCSGFSRISMLNEMDIEGKAASRLELVIEAINDKNKEQIKSLFSEKAINDADDFDESINNLFDFIKGTIVSWEEASGPSGSEVNNYGHVIKEVSSFYYVTANDQKGRVD